MLVPLFFVASAQATPNDWRKNLPEPVLGKHYEWIDLYYDTWRIADKNTMEYGGQIMLDTAFDKGKIWMWDTVWISMFGIYVQDANPAITNPMHGYDLFYSAQRPDGGIPHVWAANGNHHIGVHNPIFTLGELNYYRHTGDKSRLKIVLPILDNFFFYMKKHYAEPNGLYRNFDFHNGMDNRPISIYSIDSTCEQAMVALQLKEMAELVADTGRITKFEKEHKELASLINEKMWQDADKFYADCDQAANPVNFWSVASYWSLLAKVASPERARYMRDHLFDPSNFKTSVMVPTLGCKSTGYIKQGGDYWCGAVWVPTNAMVIEGLQAYGYPEDAREIAMNGLDGIHKTWKNTGTLFENYDQENPGKQGSRAKGDFVGMSGVEPIAILIEDIIGIRVDAPENRIYWNLGLDEENGVRNLKWGEHYSRRVALVAEEIKPGASIRTISVTSDSPFTLVLETKQGKYSLSVRKCEKQQFDIPLIK